MAAEHIVYKGKAEEIQEKLEDEMTKVNDPEVGLDVVNLGLIYDVDLDEEGVCTVTLTFTSMGCSCITEVQDNLVKVLEEMDEVSEVNLNVVWEPAWKLTRITRYGRIALGINPGR